MNMKSPGAQLVLDHLAEARDLPSDEPVDLEPQDEWRIVKFSRLYDEYRRARSKERKQELVGRMDAVLQELPLRACQRRAIIEGKGSFDVLDTISGMDALDDPEASEYFAEQQAEEYADLNQEDSD
ncbi:MAG: hypothetical protein C4521_05180 [Actinobacteria bacterium]|jgi:hypothetical protein|nr:MAG: hypothetical protein C4521_05180 [Actinomycetota bacterium]